MKGRSLYTLTAMMLCILLAGCAGNAGGQQQAEAQVQTFTSVGKLLQSTPSQGDIVRVKAALVTKDDLPYLCDTTLESDPMQPGSPNIAVSDLPLDKLTLSERRGEYSGAADIIVKLTSKIEPDGTTKAQFVRLP